VSGNAGFGVMCNYQSADSFHYLGIDAAGYYVIARWHNEVDTFLTSANDKWEQSPNIPRGLPEYRLEAVCAGDGTLTLAVNGLVVASVQDDTLLGGDIGLFVRNWNDPAVVRFDDLLVVEND
jgi:hypothetical protein